VIVKECIHNVLNERLDGKAYEPEEINDWTKTIADDIKTKLKGKPLTNCLNNLLMSW